MKKKILFVVDNLKMGGVTKVLVNLLKKINSSKYEIDILVLHFYEDMVIEIPKEINILKGGSKFSFIDENIGKILKEKNIIKLLKKISLVLKIKTGLILKSIKKDRNNNLKKNYDVEIAFGDGFPFFYVNGGNSKKRIAWLHSDVSVKDYSARYYKQIKKILPKMDMCIAVSEKVAQSYKERYGVSKIAVVNNVIDDAEIIEKSNMQEAIPYDNKQLNFVSVGRLDYSKNYEMLFRVVKRLINEGYDFKTYIVGDGADRNKLESLIKDNNMQENFILLGRKDNPYPYVKNADLFLLSSRYEGLPTVIIEALILHIPCLSTEVAGIREIINSSIGVISDNDEYSYYLELKKILDDKGIITIFKNNLKNYKYNNLTIVESVERIFDNEEK